MTSALRDLPQGAEFDAPDEVDDQSGHTGGLAMLTLGAVGVVYGDIGTSPIYAVRESLRAVAGDGLQRSEVIGVISVLIWTLVIIVTLKYVTLLLRADNRGEGGVLALYTLVRLALGRRTYWVLGLGIAGAALFFGDAIITPAISVLSAVEGLELVTPAAADFVIPATLGILVALFLVQSRGTGAVSSAFGPITAVWFLVLALTGLHNLVRDPAILIAFDPLHAVDFLLGEGPVAFLVLGAIFLAVTGAEALYADLGHFGKAPIRLAWFGLVFPALVLNYLGQGALVLARPETVDDPFFLMVAPQLLPFLVMLATIATVIASQAVITGAFSMTRGAVQLGFLPRLAIRHTSERQSGQIYIPSVNWLLFVGVVALVLSFRSSAALASAYGIAVTGTMVVTTVLTATLMLRGWKRPGWQVAAIAIPLLALESAFLASNLLKLPDGGYVPVLLAISLATVMGAWWRGVQLIRSREDRSKVDMDGFAHSISESENVLHARGTAFYFTSDPSAVPQALLHNLKHNQVLHDQNLILTVETLRVAHCPPDERISYEPIDDRFARLRLRFGYMDMPNLSRAIGQARRQGLKFDVMTSSFFLGRRKVILGSRTGIARLFDRLFITLTRFATDPGEFYSLPRNRVVELGSRITL